MIALLLALRHVAVIDGSSTTPDMTVILDGHRIASVQSDSAAVPAGAQVIDCGGQFLMPGLWDMHVHLSFAGEQALLDLVASGVTGVRDMGGDVWQIDAFRREIAAGARIGPAIVQAGPMLDGPKPGVPHRITVQTAEDGRQAASVLARGLHADFIKVHNGVPREAFFAAAAEARKLGLPLACHLPSAVTAAEASTAGCRSIEHIAESLLSSLMVQRPQMARDFRQALEDLNGPPGAELFALLAKNGTWVDPTLSAFERFADTSESTAQKEARGAALRQFFRAVVAMRRAGVRLLAGSDMAGAFWPTDVHEELRLFVEAGLSPAETLAIATHDAAAFLALNDAGSIRKGQNADLVVLRRNPLEDIRNTRSVAAVILRGKHFTAEQLQSLAVGARAR